MSIHGLRSEGRLSVVRPRPSYDDLTTTSSGSTNFRLGCDNSLRDRARRGRSPCLIVPSPPRPRQSESARRLDRLVRFARAADLWERLWRGLIPPLVVGGLFLCVSWLGLWLEVPHRARMIGAGLFATLFVVSCFGLLRLRALSRPDALRRIDKATMLATGLTHRPASVLEDRLATAGRDPATDALWTLHLRRAEADAAKLKAGHPSPRAVDLDRYALRLGIVVALAACAIVAGPQRYARVAAAFDFGPAGAPPLGSRLDAWIDPPPYTGKPPVLLDLAARDPDRPQHLAAPAGSIVVIRSAGDDAADVETTGPLLPPAKTKDMTESDGREPKPGNKSGIGPTADASTPPASENEKQLVLHGDSRLVLRQNGSLRGIFDLAAIADKPPTIALRAVPKVNARGSFNLATTTSDDYGVSAAEATFAKPKIEGEPTTGPSLVPAPTVTLALPGMSNGIGDAETTVDLSDNPWAGAQVSMALVAHDEGGNEGRSEPVEFTLPQKSFANPVARALVEQRRELVLNPSHRAVVGEALEALMVAPDSFGTTPSIYLGLRFASDSLAAARTDKQLLEVADFLWGMALQLENGDLSDAEKALRNAEKELRDAIDRRASNEEIQKLTQNLQAAMDKFLKELAEQQKKDDQQQADARQGRPSKSISQKDLQALIDRLKEQARSGNREEAKKALDELQDVLENLKTAKRQKADPQSRAMAEGLNQLDQMMRDQQELRDQTFKQGQDQTGGEPGEQQMPGMRGMGRGQQQGRREQDEGQEAQDGRQGEQGQARQGRGRPGQQSQDGKDGQAGRGRAGKGLGQRQQELHDRLGEIQKKLKRAGQGQGALDDAGNEMRDAEEALRQGEGSNGQAVDAQGRALDALRKGAKKLADAMQKQGEPGGQANSESEGGEGSKDGEQSGDSDPLGRPRGGNTINSASRFDPLGLPAAQRAQRVLEELRRRLGDPARSKEEIDYLERLLRSY